MCRRGQALAPGRADVVLVEHAQPLDPDDAGQDGDGSDRERRDRQDVRRQSPAAGDREQLQADGEDVDEPHGQQERGDGREHAARRREPQLDGSPSPVTRERRHDDSERHRDQDRDQERRTGELQRRRQPRPDDVGDVLAARQRRPEVTVCELAEVVHVLRRERIVEAEVGPALLDELGGCGQAERRPDGIAGNQVDHEERRGQQEQDRHDEPDRAPDGVGGPLVARPPPSRRPRRSGCARHVTRSASGWSARRRPRSW